MLKFQRGNVFDEVKNQPIFTTMSAFIKKDGTAFMSRGAALGCYRHYPNIDAIFGELIRKYGVISTNARGNKFLKYGVVYVPDKKVGAFQIKYHLNDNPDLELITYSATMLAGIGRMIGPLHINFPGLGKDTDNRAELYKVLESLWRNIDITLWRLNNEQNKAGNATQANIDRFMEIEEDKDEDGDGVVEEPLRGS